MKRFSTLWGVPLAAVLGLTIVGCGSSSDKTAPGTIGDFAASAKTETTITLSWTATGNDGSVGQATKSELRWSATALDAATFATGTLVAGAPAPAASGTAQSYQVTGLTAATTYYFGLMVADDAGNASYAFTSAATNACATGYTGGDCTTCATGYHDANGSCIDACSDVVDPCVAGIPAATCAGDVLTTHDTNDASCTVDLTTAPYYTCTYTAPETDCTASGEICRGGACVDNPCIPANPCTPTADACADNHTLNTYGSVCTPVDATTYDCTFPLTAVDCTATAGNVCSGDACVAAPAPIASDLAITEVMYGPTDGPQWIEILNISGTLLNLDGLQITSTTSATGHTISGTHLLAAGAYYVLGAQAASYVDYSYATDVVLSGTETVTLSVGTTTVTSLAYSGWTGAPAAKQVSSLVAATGMNKSWYWCDATDAIGSAANDKGTPGAANGTCGITVAAAPTACVLTPGTVTLAAGGAFPIVASLTWAGVTDVNQAGNDGSPLLQGETGWGAGTDATAFTWAGTVSDVAGYTTTGSVDQVAVPLIIPADPAAYNYAVRFRVYDPVAGTYGAWTYCDTTGIVADPTTGAGWGTATVKTVATQITDMLANPVGALPAAVNLGGLVVTYVRTTSPGTSDPKGFFVQASASATGPALFISVDPATLQPTPTVGDQVSFGVTTLVAVGSTGIKAPSVLVNYSRQTTSFDVGALAQDINGVDLFASTTTPTTLDDYQLELVNVDGTLASAAAGAGTGFLKFTIATTANPTLVFARFAAAVADQYDLAQGCQVSLRKVPLWRFTAEPQPTAYAVADVTAVTGCPAPKVVAAQATSATTVTVTFDRQISATSLLADGSQFTFDSGAIAVTTAALVASPSRSVSLTLASAMSATAHTVVVAQTVQDLSGTGVDAAATSVTFDGWGTCVPSVVISRFFGGAGASGAWKYDWVELYNRRDQDIALTGYSLQYGAAGNKTWSSSNALSLSGTIPARGYFAIKLAGSAANGGSDFTADVTGTINMSGTNGKVALVKGGTTTLSTDCGDTNPNRVDLVGYGTSQCWEGTAAMSALTATNSVGSRSDICVDTNANSADFGAVDGASNGPRNGSTTPPATACVCGG